MRLILTLILLVAACAKVPVVNDVKLSSQETEVDKAVSAAKILPQDSLEVKIEKTLQLINRDRYYDPKGPPPKLDPVYYERYHLDSLRTPEQILQQKIGGYCGTAALVFTAMLKKSGVPDENMRIVAAVNAPDLLEICPSAKEPRRDRPRTGASGHVFVSVKMADGQWHLINTVDGPKYETMVWLTPLELTEKMKTGAVQIPFPMYKNHPPEARTVPMVVFQVWRPNDFPLHTFEQRLDLIASGKIGKPEDQAASREAQICRYGGTDVAGLKKHD